MNRGHMFWLLLLTLVHLAGVLTAIRALFTSRSSHSAIAWAISCVTFPYVAVPAFWVFGRNRFDGYVLARKLSQAALKDKIKELHKFPADKALFPADIQQSHRVFERLGGMPFTGNNSAELLIDGDAAFGSIFERIESAREYVLIQFFILRDDELGRRMLQLLSKKVEEGVRVCIIYDKIGSYRLPREYVRSARKAGVEIHAFKTMRRWSNRFQINFRNHRKIVLIDGCWAATGGINLGIEWCREVEGFGVWRDTMVAVTGPSVQEIQYSFAEDWFFVTEEILDLNWAPSASSDENKFILVLPTGPADDLYACSMILTQAINSAEKRLWMTTPYFAPDIEIIRALQLAALRGVDVRLLLPDKPDNQFVYWASFAYIDEMENAGVKFYRYQKSLLHEKVFLIDNGFSFVGSTNIDARSFYLNFEIMLLIADSDFAGKIEQMLENDFEHSCSEGVRRLNEKGLLFNAAVRLSRLFYPAL